MSHTSHCIVELAGEPLMLLPERAVFRPATRSLLVADLHLGKAGHFRKHGIPIPGQVQQEDLARLEALIDRWQASEVVCLGDLFHSDYNQEWKRFGDWWQQQCQRRSGLRFCLVPGNHDILPRHHYQQLAFEIWENGSTWGPFKLQHHPSPRPDALNDTDPQRYELAGHLHPGVRLLGEGRQHMRLPCFYFSQTQGILPAFGAFTGLHLLQPKADDRVFGIAEGQVLPLL